MKAPPRSTKDSLASRLNSHARTTWPVLVGIEVRFQANFAYIDGRHRDGSAIKLWRLRYGGSAHTWGFGINPASHDDYEDA